jgi:hypothetical protein
VVTYYGVRHTPSGVKSFYEMIVRWFTSLGFPPDKIGVTGPGHGRKLVTFARGNAKLQRNGFDKVREFELISSTPDARTGGEFYLVAIYGGCEKSHAYVAVRSSFATLSRESLLAIARETAQYLKPEYGIAYRRDHNLGPTWYAAGINFATEFVVKRGAAYEEALTISRWCDLGRVEKVWQDGLLRDIYPWNFLSPPQLDMHVDGIPLKRWIPNEPRRGKLSDFCCGLSLWEVSESELRSVRPALVEAGAIFDWTKYA